MKRAQHKSLMLTLIQITTEKILQTKEERSVLM